MRTQGRKKLQKGHDIKHTAVSVASETFSAEQSQGASSVGFVLNAQGANVSNIVFNVTAPKPKKRFCLSLKERRRRLQIRKEQEN